MPSKDYSKTTPSPRRDDTPSRDSSLAEPSLPLHSTMPSHDEVLIEERHSTPVGGASFTSEPSPVRASHTQSPEVHESHHYVEPIGEEPLEEEAEIEVRTVHRTERHIHDTDDGPIVEETTVTITYENDEAVKEETHKRTDDLTEEEYEKWNKMHREAERVLNSEEGEDIPEGMHREIREVCQSMRVLSIPEVDERCVREMNRQMVKKMREKTSKCELGRGNVGDSLVLNGKMFRKWRKMEQS